MHSLAIKKRVPNWTASAPNIKAAAIPRPSPIPPAAITGIDTASTICGKPLIVVNLPICPPASIPSKMTASAPIFSILFAKATEGTTGITLMLCSLKRAMYLAGLPAPVVTTGTCSSQTKSTISSAKGESNIILTPKGCSVNSLTFLISFFTTSFGALPPAIIPNPPAFDTALANEASATQAIPP